LTPLLACCLLIACASGPQPTPEPVLIYPITVPPPASLLVAPQVLLPPASGRMADLESNHRAVARAYHQLAAQLCALLTYIKEAPNDGCN
jgi:hypothetical protein